MWLKSKIPTRLTMTETHHERLLHPSVIGDLKEQLQKAAPREAVGFIYESGTIVQLVNEAPGIRQFEVSEEQVFSSIPNSDLPYLSFFYHTHPNTNAQPSQYDLDFMSVMAQGMPHLNYIIVAPDAMQIWAVRSSGPCILGHYPI